MKMGSYHNRNTMISEPNKEAPVPHFAWIHPGNLFSTTNIGLNPFLANEMDPKPDLDALPICHVPPLTEPAKNIKFETKPTKVKRKKSTPKSSNQTAPKVVRPKQTKKKPSSSKKTKRQLEPGTKVERKNLNVVFNEANLDFCTGVAGACYKWGAGGWQSSCCTTNISEYRMAGRKMSIGAYGKLLHRLSTEGHDLSHPVDLKDHWARHGTNKFVTIK